MPRGGRSSTGSGADGAEGGAPPPKRQAIRRARASSQSSSSTSSSNTSSSPTITSSTSTSTSTSTPSSFAAAPIAVGAKRSHSHIYIEDEPIQDLQPRHHHHHASSSASASLHDDEGEPQQSGSCSSSHHPPAPSPLDSSVSDGGIDSATGGTWMAATATAATATLVRLDKNVDAILRDFEKEDEETRRLNAEIKKQQAQLKTLEARKRRRIDEFRERVREEKMRVFRARLHALADLNEQLRELQLLASDLELSVLQECPVCYEVVFVPSAANTETNLTLEEEDEVEDKLPQTLKAKVMTCSHALCVSCFYKCAKPCSDLDENDHFHVDCPVCRANQAVFFEEDLTDMDG